VKHPEDHELLLATVGESAEAEAHLAWCAVCRSRQSHLLAELDETKADGRGNGEPEILHDRMRAKAKTRWRYAAAGAAAAAALLAISISADEPLSVLPRPALTPGAARAISRSAVCAVKSDLARREISSAATNEVFQRYGMRDPVPGRFEVDHLIPLELGGSDEPRNLWPQPLREGKWNSRVKDALEERLRTMVCNGTLDLRTAQKEIAEDWVAAYRKYFHSTEPQPAHMAFVKIGARK